MDRLPSSGFAARGHCVSAANLGADLPPSRETPVTLAEPAVPPAPRWMSSATRRAWTIALGGTFVAVLLASAVLPRAVQPFEPLSVAFVAVLFLVCESVSMHVEFRQQTYSW